MRAFFIFLFSLLFYGTAIAQQQNGISAEIRVSATLIQTIELITVNTIELGNVQPGQKVVSINPISDLNAGHMIAIGTPDAEFRLSYLAEKELVQTDGSGTIVFQYSISGSTEDVQSTSELLQSDNRNISFNSNGRYYIWVGGTINLENAAPGMYEGDFTIEIDYI